jgi:hypothetical protein
VVEKRKRLSFEDAPERACSQKFDASAVGFAGPTLVAGDQQCDEALSRNDGTRNWRIWVISN